MAYRKIEFSKIDRPASVSPGSAPQLQWLDIASLVVDEGYQRELRPGNWRAIRAIAKGFRWSMFSPVFVAPVEGGLFAIIDGQHRTHAAAICGFSQVPCQIVQMTPTEQAAAFAAVNGTVTKVTALQIFKAAMASGDGWAVRLREIAEPAGCSMGISNASSADKKPGVIFAVGGFRQLVERHGGGLTPVLAVLRKAEGWATDAKYWDGGILVPVLSALCQRPALLDNPDLLSGLGEWDPFEAVAKAKERRLTRAASKMPAFTVRELVESSLLDWLDKRFPARVVAAEKLSRAGAMARIGAMGGV